MSWVIFALTGANLLYYFAFASITSAFSDVFPGLASAFSDVLPCALAALLLGPAACALGSLADRKKPKLRFLFILMPLCSLLPGPWSLSLLFIVPAVLYPVILLLAERFSVFYWDYRNHVLFSSCVLLLMLLLSQVRAVRPLPVLFGMGSLILSIFTLRQIRFGAKTGPKQKLLELISLSSLPAAVWGLVVLLSRTKKIAGWAAEKILYPFALALQKIVSFIAYIASLFNLGKQTPEPPRPPDQPEHIYEAWQEALPYEEPEIFESTIDMKIAAAVIVIGIILAVLLAVWIFRRLRETRSEESLKAQTELKTEADEGGVRLPGKLENSSNRRRIRRIYEKYLKLLDQRSFIRRPQDSSQEIIEKTQDILPEATSQALRKLYIAARYDPNAAITGAQVREAKRLLKKLTEESKA